MVRTTIETLLAVAVLYWLAFRYLLPWLKRIYGPEWSVGWPHWFLLIRGLALLPIAGPLKLIDWLLKRYVEPKAFGDKRE